MDSTRPGAFVSIGTVRSISITALWVAGLLCLGLLWWRYLWPSAPASKQEGGRAVLAQLEAYVEERSAHVRELADRISSWESLPEAALYDALRSLSARHTGLGLLLVADPAGRLLAGYDPNRRIGDERLLPGSLDPVLGRRELLGRGPGVLPSSNAGLLTSLDLVAPVRRADGSRPGYVGVTLDLGPLRQRLRAHGSRGLSLRVSTAEGQLMFPCTGEARGAGEPVSSTLFRAWVEREARRGFLITILASVLLLGALLMGTRALTRLDRDR